MYKIITGDSMVYRLTVDEGWSSSIGLDSQPIGSDSWPQKANYDEISREEAIAMRDFLNDFLEQ